MTHKELKKLLLPLEYTEITNWTTGTYGRINRFLRSENKDIESQITPSEALDYLAEDYKIPKYILEAVLGNRLMPGEPELSKLQKILNFPVAHLDEIQWIQSGLRLSQFYEILNSPKISQERIDRLKIQSVKKRIKILSSAFNKIPPSEGVVYRYITYDKTQSELSSKPYFEKLQHLKAQDIYEDLGFMSVSRLRNELAVKADSTGDFATDLLIEFIIETKSARSIENMGFDEDESEAIILPGVKFRVLDVYSKANYRIIALKEI